MAATPSVRPRWNACDGERGCTRATGLPILVSGGSPYATRTSEAAQMKAVLEQDFRTEVKWAEEKSFDTFENARYARRLLAAAGSIASP